jgi:hypothetical protein
MGVLEQVTQMRNSGMGDDEIISSLQEQGVSPKAIDDALGQANIKTAVSGEDTAGMESSGYGQNQENAPAPRPQPGGGYSPKTYEMSGENQEMYAPQQQYAPQQEEENYPSQPQQDYSYQEYYPQEGQGYAGAADSDTMVEIAQQVFAEKIKKIQQQLDDLNEFKTLYQTKTDNISERLKRVEEGMDKLQMAILQRIGDYSKGVDSIKKELSMIEDSFGKMIGKVAERHEARRTAAPQPPAKTKKRTAAAKKKK